MAVSVKIKKSLGDFSLDVEFETRSGVMGLLGASGCGKSVTLGCIAGTVRPDEGKIVVNGETLFDSERGVDLPPQRRRAGLLFQNCALFPNMTVEENILCALTKRTKNAKKIKDGSVTARAASLAEKFYLRGLEKHYPAQLSGGQKQRAAMARIMAAEPSLLMLDEPLSALDSYLRWQLEEELAQILGEFGGSALYVSHNRDEVYRLCDEVCVIDSGRSEKIRTVKELFESPDTVASALLSGCKNYSRAEKLGARSVRALDWGVSLACAADVPDGIRCVGVRARDIALRDGALTEAENNGFPCRVERVTEDVFSMTANLRPLNCPADNGFSHFSRIRAEFPKRREFFEMENFETGCVVFAEIKPSSVMLLKD